MRVLILVFLLGVAGLAYVRLAPSDPARWNVDPETAQDPGAGGVLRRHATPLPPEQAMALFAEATLAEPRTRGLAGSPEQGRMTFIARSKVFGFPDYITVTATATDSGSQLTILSRLRFGGSDLGVNRARLERILQRL